MSDYEKYRGKCRKMAESLVHKNSALTLVRGYYHCPEWGKQQHWWTKTPTGGIIDPTKNQFPSKGSGRYEEFDGILQCDQCSVQLSEKTAYIDGKYAFCNESCFMRFVGVL
jgi:hypothetical protein